jgi:tetratricopeptide (TPR) repeat protein
MKNRSNLKKNVLLNDVDIGDADPVWLNAKGDEFYERGDFCSAINAYSEALVADETMVQTLGKRAACYLHLREGSCCIKDCLAALEMSDASESQFDAIAEKAQFLKKTHMRLALAYCLNEEYTNGMEHFATAHHLDENDKVATECINYLETLMEAMEWKAKADDSFAEGDLVKAKEFYTKALLVDPEFIKALMNRAACQLAMEDAAGSIDDCSLALDLIPQGKPKQQSSCPIASVLIPKPSVQRKWVVTLLCRRAAARRLAKDLDGALADLEEARTVCRNDDIGAVEKSIACLKKEMA